MSYEIKASILSVPVEVDYMADIPEDRVKAGTDVFVTAQRGQGQLPVMPKIAPVSLIKWMESHGYTNENYDFYDVDMLLPDDDEIRLYLRDYQPTVVGLSAVVSTCYAQVKRLSKIIREECPNAWVVVGGSITASANLVLQKSDSDICIVGDGEIPWVDFLDYVKQFGRELNYEEIAKIKGLAYLGLDQNLIFNGYGKAIPGELNPFPDYDILLSGLKNHPEYLDHYFRPGRGSTHLQTDKRTFEPHRRPMLAQLWSSKGCVARCTFCQRSTKGYRVLGIEALDEHLEMLKTTFNVGFVHILDENFSSDKKYAYKFAECMKKHDMLWMASGVRVSSVGRKDIEFYRENNCVSLKFGVESGSQKIMDVMEKKFTIERVYETLKHCSDLQMYSPLAVMVGMPGETLTTAKETGEFVGKLCHMQGIDPKYNGVSIFYALPLTGTPLYVYGQQKGVIGKSPDQEEAFLMSVSGTGASKINYINLNGAKLEDIVWWDWLVRLEARYVFKELNEKNPLGEPNFLQKTIIEDKKREIIGRAMSVQEVLTKKRFGWVKSKISYILSDHFEDLVIQSDLLLKLPRKVSYPVLKKLVFLKYVLIYLNIRRVHKKVEFNLWKNWKRVDPLGVSESNKKNESGKLMADLSRSLRAVVKETEKTLPNKPKHETDQDILSIGL